MLEIEYVQIYFTELRCLIPYNWSAMYIKIYS